MTRLFQAMAGAVHGGAEAFFTRLALALQEAGQEQKLAIRTDPARGQTLREGGCEVAEFRFGGFFDWRTRPGLRRILREWEPKVVLTWMSRATKVMPKGSYVHVARLGGYYDLKYYRRCNHLIGNTQDIVRHLTVNGWPKARVHYLPNFVDDTPAEPVDRESLETPDDAPLLLALGRLHPNKGFDVLIEAMALAPRAWLWLAGAGPEEANLKAQAQRLGVDNRIRFLGWRDDAPALMAAADALVCPSRHEPLGNVILEAWAHGLPVIAAEAQGPLELVRPNVNGLLVPLEDAASLARAIHDLTSDMTSRLELSEAGYDTFARRFGRGAVVAAYRDFFDRVAR
ncbi:MAG TPA: glycosyltransferase [Stellaceae bacterium]|nr:glycosyltransferase [Stellaceae bacterium]